MNYALVIFTIGIPTALLLREVDTNQPSSCLPPCNSEISVKIVHRDVYDEILYNQELVDLIAKEICYL